MTKQETVIKRLALEGYRVNKDGQVLTPKGLIRKLSASHAKDSRPSYYRFNVKHEGKSYPVRVHKLAAYLKFGEDAFVFLVRHLDGNSLNNKDENLALGNGSDNAFDRPSSERKAHSYKASKVLRKLTDDEVFEIRGSSESLRVLASRFGVVKSTIHNVKSGKLYANVMTV